MAPRDGGRPGTGALLHARGIRRSVDLFRAFRVEQTDPDRFYRIQAADAVAQLRRYAPLEGRLVLDIGGGAGYFTEAFTAAGARCVLVEPEAHRAASPAGHGDGAAHDDDAHDGDDDDRAEGADPDAARRRRHRRAVRPGRLAPGRTVAADGHRLPVPDGTSDVTFSSNVLEHVPAAAPFLAEMVRVTRPGGTIYVSFTAWYSFWGGHETAPWHYLGGHRAARRYERRTGRPPGNRFGSSLFACHVGPTLRLARALPGVDVVDALPRYYPDWLRWVVEVPGVRELATWNLLLVLRRHRGAP
ncbi:MAG TPA: class I SAM-dependent methyltransferase [Acidimicrobiales bacterium]|nr:class I SAM-dependent methyltransferase [Acidimicrobiales bacterium]